MNEIRDSRVRRLYGRHLIIEAKDGSEHLIRLEKGGVQTLIATMGKALPPDTTAMDVRQWLVARLPGVLSLGWIVAGAFLADKYRAHATLIIAVAVGGPLVLFGFFFRGATVAAGSQLWLS